MTPEPRMPPEGYDPTEYGDHGELALSKKSFSDKWFSGIDLVNILLQLFIYSSPSSCFFVQKSAPCFTI